MNATSLRINDNYHPKDNTGTAQLLFLDLVSKVVLSPRNVIVLIEANVADNPWSEQPTEKS